MDPITEHKPESDKVDVKSDVTKEVQSAISAAGPEIRSSLVTVLASREIEKRKAAAVKIVDQLVSFEKELQKIKPDQKFVDAAGKPVLEVYSPEVQKSRKDLEDKITKYRNALNKAFDTEKPDFQPLLQLAG